MVTNNIAFLDCHVSKNRSKLEPNPWDSHPLRCRTYSNLIAVLDKRIAAQIRINLYSGFLIPLARQNVSRETL